MIVFNKSESVISLDPEIHVSIPPHKVVNLTHYAKDVDIAKCARLQRSLKLGLLVSLHADTKMLHIQNTLKRYAQSGQKAVFIPAQKNQVVHDIKSITRRELVGRPTAEKIINTKEESKKVFTEALQKLREPVVVPPKETIRTAQCKGMNSSGQPCKKRPLLDFDRCLIHLTDEQRKIHDKNRAPTLTEILNQ